MARTEHAATNLAHNAGTVVTETVMAAGATGTSGYYISGVKADSGLTIRIDNEGSATGVFSIKEGDYCNDSQGDLAVTVGVNVVKAIMLDGARFRTSDGYINVDAGTTGTLTATQQA